VRTDEGKLFIFVAIDRTSKAAFVQLHERANTKTAVAFLNDLIEAMPYAIHTVLTDNGIQFADLPRNREQPTALWRGHPFDRACAAHGIEHRLTKPNHLWTNGQVERMNRTLKDATVRRYHYESHDRLKEHLAAFVDAYNFAKRLKPLKGLTPFEFVTKRWTNLQAKSNPALPGTEHAPGFGFHGNMRLDADFLQIPLEGPGIVAPVGAERGTAFHLALPDHLKGPARSARLVHGSGALPRRALAGSP